MIRLVQCREGSGRPGARGGRKPVRRGLNIQAADGECPKRQFHGPGEDGGFKSLVIMFGERNKGHLPGLWVISWVVVVVAVARTGISPWGKGMSFKPGAS